MDDLISRQAAIDAKQEFRNPNVVRNTEARTAYDRTYANGWNDCNSAWINAIKALPSAQPEQRWISVSERPPKDGTEVFVYLFDRPSPYIAWIEGMHWYTEDFEVDVDDEPIAWKPLPSPYQKEGEK